MPLIFANPLSLILTESDPDAFIQNCVNVINGHYCEAVTDLVITGPDPLVLQRFYSAKEGQGLWRIFPERLLVIGKDFAKKNMSYR